MSIATGILDEMIASKTAEAHETAIANPLRYPSFREVALNAQAEALKEVRDRIALAEKLSGQ